MAYTGTGAIGFVETAGTPGLLPSFRVHSSTFSGGIITSPTDSHTATVAFGSVALGTAIQNSLGYDVLVNYSLSVSVVGSGTLSVGVGPTSTPTTDVVNQFVTSGTFNSVSTTAIVPSGYWLLINCTTPAIVSNTQVCPI